MTDHAERYEHDYAQQFGFGVNVVIKHAPCLTWQVEYPLLSASSMTDPATWLEQMEILQAAEDAVVEHVRGCPVCREVPEFAAMLAARGLL